MEAEGLAARLADLIGKCLEKPGEYVNKLTRTDGIMQDGPIAQLYSNFFRIEQYDFITCTPFETDLEELNSEIQKMKFQIIDSGIKFHEGPFENLKFAISQYQAEHQYCPCTLLQAIHQKIIEHANILRLNMMAVDSEKNFTDNIVEHYTNFTRFIVVLEDRLPELSSLLNEIPSNGYPFSLWKFLHEEYIDLIIVPLLPQLVDNIVLKINFLRKREAEMVIRKEAESLELMEEAFILKAAVSIITDSFLDEMSVHFLESSVMIPPEVYEDIEQRVLLGIEDFYQEIRQKYDRTVYSQVRDRDLLILEKIFLPCSISKFCEALHDEENEDSLFRSHCGMQHIRDVEVELYTTRLGILVTQ